MKVYVSIGTGIKQVTVPSLVNKTQEDASKELTDSGLKVALAYEEDTTKSNGLVLKQSVDAGKVVDEGTTVTITINKITEIKNGTVNINLKSLLNYTKPATNANTEEKEEPKVEVKVTVGDDTVYKEEHAKDTTKITVPVSGKGVITVKVYVDDVLKTTKTLDLNSATVLNIE